METEKIKNLKTGDLVRSLKTPDLPTMLVIGVKQWTTTVTIHAIYDNDKIEIDDYNDKYETEVEIISRNNDVTQLRKIHRLQAMK